MKPMSLRHVCTIASVAAWCTLSLAVPALYIGLHWIEPDGGTRASPAEAATVAAVCLLLGTLAAALVRRLLWRQLERVVAEQQGDNLRFHTAINNMSHGLCFFDGQQRLIVCNDRYAQMYDLARDQVRPGTTLRQIVELRYAAGSCPEMSKAEYLQWRDSVAVANKPTESITTLKDGRVYIIRHQPMPDGGWVATHEDITEQRRTQAQIERMARHDALTGLPNRVLFRERLNEAVGRSLAGESLAVLCLDLDRFKAVNDTLGHPTGDELLRSVAQRLGHCLRQSDLVARLGGDEFAIIQTGAVQPAAARALSERLVRAIAEPFDISGHQALVGTSIGIVLSPDDGIDPDDLLKKADLALYEVKAAGRGTFKFFQSAMHEQAQGRRTLEIDLGSALANNELFVDYQPIVALDTQRTVVLEALLRWNHPTRGLVMPDQFIALAEETGQIQALGGWVLRRALLDARLWPDDVSVAVNLSPLQFNCGDLVQVIATALAETGIASTRLQLEITESVRLAEDSANLGVLRRLRELGVRICLDDFGVGYSSLSYLRSFPFKKIKIDRSFVRDVLSNAESQAIVRAVATLGASLQMAITAEGVEHAAQLDMLRDLGCNEAQGFHIGRPQPAGDVGALLQAERAGGQPTMRGDTPLRRTEGLHHA